MTKMWTDERVEFLRSIAKGKRPQEITELVNERFDINLKESQIKGALSRFRIRTGMPGTFQKGSVPWNKGMKGWSAPGTEHTRFKKGQPSTTKMVVGARSVISGYMYEKVADTGVRWNDWRPVSQLVWEKHHGEIPDGHIIIFLDKDTSNIDIDNLACVKRETSAQMNRQGLHDTYADITRVGISLTELKRKLKESERA